MTSKDPDPDRISPASSSCKYAAGQRVRVGERQDVAPLFRQVEGTVEAVERTDFGCLYRVKLTSASENLAQLRALVFHEEQLTAASA